VDTYNTISFAEQETPDTICFATTDTIPSYTIKDMEENFDVDIINEFGTKYVHIPKPVQLCPPLFIADFFLTVSGLFLLGAFLRLINLF
jgi:hypothetical protein